MIFPKIRHPNDRQEFQVDWSVAIKVYSSHQPIEICFFSVHRLHSVQDLSIPNISSQRHNMFNRARHHSRQQIPHHRRKIGTPTFENKSSAPQQSSKTGRPTLTHWNDCHHPIHLSKSIFFMSKILNRLIHTKSFLLGKKRYEIWKFIFTMCQFYIYIHITRIYTYYIVIYGIAIDLFANSFSLDCPYLLHFFEHNLSSRHTYHTHPNNPVEFASVLRNFGEIVSLHNKYKNHRTNWNVELIRIYGKQLKQLTDLTHCHPMSIWMSVQFGQSFRRSCRSRWISLSLSSPSKSL